MSRLIPIPSLAIDFLPLLAMNFDVRGSAVDTGRDSLGVSQSIEMTGGGSLRGSYTTYAHLPEHHEYLNWLSARLNGSHRYINVPIYTDVVGPFPVIGGVSTPIINDVPHSDGSLFSDDSGYSQTTVWGEVTEAAALNAGVLEMQVFGLERRLRWSDWFSIMHPTRGWRAYRYWQVLDDDGGVDPVYSLAVSPALREAVAVGTRVEFARPRFVAKFPSDYTLAWDVRPPHAATSELKFIEAF